MNLIDNKQKLPGGLVDESGEFFIYKNEIHCLYKGKTYSLVDFPEEIIAIIDADMAKHPKAIKALIDWDITDPFSQIRQYVACRFGGFDSRPDFTSEGDSINVEYVDCGRRGKCPYEGKLCSSIVLENGQIITKREIEVLRGIAAGLLDKEICDQLDIAQETLRSHKDSVSQKAGISRKSALTALAFKYDLL